MTQSPATTRSKKTSHRDTLLPLLAATANGDQDAYASLYQESAARLFPITLRIVKRKEIAEEVLQEAFVRIWYHASDYHAEKGSVFNWMATIVRYRSLDHLRRSDTRAKSLDTMEPNELPDSMISEEDATLKSNNIALNQCMEQLSEDQRHTISLAFLEGYTHHDLSVKLSKPLGTVKSWVRRGLESLKKCLTKVAA